MKGFARPSRKSLLILMSLGIIVALTIAVVFFTKAMNQQSRTVVSTQENAEEAPEVIEEKEARDETLGSGFTVMYPETWNNEHTGAEDPNSIREIQKDENVITSPSGALQVVLETQTNTQIGGTCSPEFIQLKYLSTDETPDYDEGRYAAYVVYFPSLNLYQYHIGLQKNTTAIQAVTVGGESACSFMFGEFIDRESFLADVPLTRTRIYIRIPELQNGDDLKAGITEAQVAEKLTGTEFEQAKTIVQSVRITNSY